MFRIILAILALIGVMIFASWLGRASAAQRSRAIKLIFLYGIAGGLLLLVVTGRIPWMFAIISAAAPWIQRFFVARQAWNTIKASRGPSSGQTSKVETAILRMTLYHDSGDLDGEVISGQFSGKLLSELSDTEILELLKECRYSDSQSASILEAYLDRKKGQTWREEFDSQNYEHDESEQDRSMSISQASEILGVSKEAGRDEIISAHRRLIQQLHTDRGGTDYLAALINEARDTLLSIN